MLVTAQLAPQISTALMTEQYRRLVGLIDLELVAVADIPLAPNCKRKLVDTSGRAAVTA